MRSLVPTRANGTDNGVHLSTPLRNMPWDTGLFDRLIWGPSHGAVPRGDGAPMEILDLEDSIQVSVEVPGIDPKDLDISLTGQVLTLAAEKRDENEGQPDHRTYTERQFGTFRRSIKLPCPVEGDKVNAVHKYGVVTITLQKSESVRPRRIQIDIA